jgi:prepilin-type N-terminal cleavage/methylation domain-containing protein
MSASFLNATESGFTLIEVMIAILVITVAALALEGGATAAVRDLAASEREQLATRLAERQRERIWAASCAGSSGVDSANGVVARWVAAPGTSATHVTQHTTFTTALGTRTESYDAMGRCR